MALLKKLVGVGAVAVAGYVVYNEYQRRKEQGDEFVLKIDAQINNLVEDLGAKVDNALEKIEAKLSKSAEAVEELVEE